MTSGAKSLSELSEAATQGSWAVEDNFGNEDLNIIVEGGEFPIVGGTEWTILTPEDGEFITRLVNAYRAGELIEV